MVNYIKLGDIDFSVTPVTPKIRNCWEFFIILSGEVNFLIDSDVIKVSEQTLIVFQPLLLFGCSADTKVKRIVIDYHTVPIELSEEMKLKPYLKTSLSDQECSRVNRLAIFAEKAQNDPTHLYSLQQQSVLFELSLLAMKNIPMRVLNRTTKIKNIVDRALFLYEGSLNENPRIEDIALKLNISSGHLRQLFVKAGYKSPKEAFNYLRMRQVKHLLMKTDLILENIAERTGFTDASELCRFVKKRTGQPPKTFRAKDYVEW